MDTLILHDGTVPLCQVTAAAEEATRQGRVLVSTTEPKNRRWKTIVRLSGKEAQP